MGLAQIPVNAPAAIAPAHSVGFDLLAGASMAAPMHRRPRRPDAPAEAQPVGRRGAGPARGERGGSRRPPARTQCSTHHRRVPDPPEHAGVRPPGSAARHPRATPRFFWSCTVGGKNIAAGKKAFVGVCATGGGPAQRPPGDPAVRRAPRLHPHAGRSRPTTRAGWGSPAATPALGNWRVRVAYGGAGGFKPAGSLGVKVVAKAQQAAGPTPPGPATQDPPGVSAGGAADQRQVGVDRELHVAAGLLLDRPRPPAGTGRRPAQGPSVRTNRGSSPGSCGSDHEHRDLLPWAVSRPVAPCRCRTPSGRRGGTRPSSGCRPRTRTGGRTTGARRRRGRRRRRQGSVTLVRRHVAFAPRAAHREVGLLDVVEGALVVTAGLRGDA